jgi:hypothetical protein
MPSFPISRPFSLSGQEKPEITGKTGPLLAKSALLALYLRVSEQADKGLFFEYANFKR